MPKCSKLTNIIGNKIWLGAYKNGIENNQKTEKRLKKEEIVITFSLWRIPM